MRKGMMPPHPDPLPRRGEGILAKDTEEGGSEGAQDFGSFSLDGRR